MRAPTLMIPLVAALGVAVVLFAVRSELAEANHSTPGAVDTHIVHVHDDYFHPEPLSPTWADHNAAQADCQSDSPPSQCDLVIDVGDSVEWWTKDPFHTNTHTVTECADSTFTNCGPTADAANPIGDSGVFDPVNPPANTRQYGPITFATAGTFYYRCDVHPTTMRGRVVVQAVQATPSPTPSPTSAGAPTSGAVATQTPATVPGTGGDPGDGGASWPLVLVMAGAAVIVGCAALGLASLRRP